MKIEEHEKACKEHIENFKKSIEEGIKDNQLNIGYNISQGSVELFVIYLHKLRLLQDSGDQFDHRIFKNKFQINRKIPVEFPDRKKILDLMKEIELERNVICYGKRKPERKIEEVIEKFQRLRRLINKNIKQIK